MDDAVRKDLLKTLDLIVKSGEPTVDPELLKKVKSICKKGNDYVEAAHHFLMTMLTEDHCQIRLSAMQVSHELFLRSSTFRTLLLENFKDFVELVISVNSSKPLPPPLEASNALNTFALKSVREWNSKFADSYVRLRVGFSYLLRTKQKEFDDLDAREAAQARQRALLLSRQEARDQRELEKATDELNSTAMEIQNCANEVDSICNLLIPNPDDFLINEFNDLAESEEKEKKAEDDGDFLAEAMEPERFKYRSHGIANSFSLEIKVKAPGRLVENEDNADLLVQLKDHRKLFDKTYLPKLNKWIRVFSRNDKDSDHLKRCHDLKEMITSRMEKMKSISILNDSESLNGDEDEMSDSDLEDVPEKEHYEADVVPEVPTTSKKSRPQNVKVKQEPSVNSKSVKPRSFEAQLSKEELKDPTIPKLSDIKDEPVGDDDGEAGPSTSSGESGRRELLGKVPNLPFDIDLINWGQETSSAVYIRNEALHRFWKGSEGDEVVVPKSTIESVTKRRTVTFLGKFEPVTHQCRAPLQLGGLCQRMDRRKCPFHGVIIPRDELGQPLDEGDRARIAAEQELADAVARRQKVLEERRAKKETKLVNLKKIKNSPKKRIMKKVLNRGSLNRVASVMNAIDSRKRDEKFGTQFNYSLNNSR